jgi:DNA repair exonuclease SbcCD ATPase subunit
MTTLNNYNIYNKNINNLFDNIENRVQSLEKLLNEIKHIEFNYYKILAINETLLNENEELKQIIEKQNIKITNLENEIKELKENDIKQKEEIKELKNKIIKLENTFTKSKYIMALQDLNSYDKLESNLKYPFNNNLKKLRLSRNYDCHYMYDTDSNDVINKKKYYLLHQLNNMSKDIKNNINNIYGKCNLIENIIKYLEETTDVNSEVSDEDLSFIEAWWDDNF